MSRTRARVSERARARVQIVRAYFRGELAGWSTITEYEA